jgi:hypothetical protein
MTIRNVSNQQGRLASLFFAVAVAGSLAACGGGGGGGAPAAAPAAAPAPAAPAPPAAAPTSQLVLTLATPSNANGTITTAGATFTRVSSAGDQSSGNSPYCSITVNGADKGASKYQVVVYFLKANGAVFNAQIDDETFSRDIAFGGDITNPTSTVMSVEPLAKYINFSNAVFADSSTTAPVYNNTATVNGKLYFGVANSTDVCGN